MTQAPHRPEKGFSGRLDVPDGATDSSIYAQPTQPNIIAPVPAPREAEERKKPWLKRTVTKVGAAALAVAAAVGITYSVTKASNNPESVGSGQVGTSEVGSEVPGPNTATPSASQEGDVVTGEGIEDINKNLPRKGDIPTTKELTPLEEALMNPNLSVDQVRDKMAICIQSHLEAGDEKGAAFYLLGLDYIPGSDEPVINPKVAEDLAINHWGNLTALTRSTPAQASEKGLAYQLSTADSGIISGVKAVYNPETKSRTSFKLKYWSVTEEYQAPDFPPETRHFRAGFAFVPDSPTNQTVGRWRMVLTKNSYQSLLFKEN